MSIYHIIQENNSLPITSGNLEEDKVSLFESLPYDILCHIQRYLNPSDTQKIAETSTLLNWSMVSAANVNSIHDLKSFAQRLTQSLNPEISLNQIKALSDITDSIHNQGVSNLRDLKTQIIGTKNQIIDVLVTLDPEELKSLKTHATPKYCENLFQVAEICQLLSQADTVVDLIERCEILLQAFQMLTQVKALDRPESAIAINRAIDIANSTPNQRDKCIALMLIFTALSKAKKPEANPIIDEALQIARTLPNEEEQEEALRRCSLALARAQEFERAIEVAREIICPIIQSIVLSKIFIPLMQSGETERANAVMQESLDLAQTIPFEEDLMQALHKCSLALCSVGEFERAITIASDITDPLMRSLVFTKIFVPLAKSGAIARADEIMNLAIELANSCPNDHGKAWTLMRCVKSLLTLGQIAKACSVAKSIGDPEMQTKSLKKCSQSRIEAGMPYEAYLIAKNIQDNASRGEIYYDCALALLQEGKIIESYMAVRDITDIDLKEIGIRNIIDYCFRANEFETAATIASSLINPQVRDQTLMLCSIELSRNGAFSAASKNANLIADAEMKGEALKVYSNALISAGQLDAGREIGESILNTEKKGEALFYCSVVFIKAKRSIEGIEIAKAIPNQNLRWDALRDCTFALIDIGEMDLALEVANSIPKDWRSPSLLKIAEARTEAGELELALKIAITIPDLYEQGCALLKIVNSHLSAKNLVEAGKISQAIKYSETRGLALMNYSSVLVTAGRVDEAIETTQKILDDKNRSHALKTIVHFYVLAKQLDKALPIASDIPDVEEKDLALAEIVEAHCLAQEFNAAVSVANRMKRKMTRLKNIVEIALCQARLGQFDQAITFAHTLPESMKWKAISEIIKVATRNGERTLPTNLVNTIPDHTLRQATLFAMVTILSSDNEMDLATKHAHMIDHSYMRDRALRYINEIASLDLEESGDKISIPSFEELD